MVLPKDMIIKEEIDVFESISYEDNLLEGLSDPDYDIKIEVEVSGTHLSLDKIWHMKSEFSNTELDNSEVGGISYESLRDYCEQTCSFCHEQFWDSYSLLQHNVKHLKLQLKPIDLISYECSKCNQHFVDRRSLKNHELKHALEKNAGDNDHFKITKMLHQCKICGKIQNYKTWHAHMREVHSDVRYICTVCNLTFKCLRYLRNHKRRVHEPARKKEKQDTSVSCPQCPAKLHCKDSLRTHVRNCHTEKVECHICKSLLKSRSYLQTHLKRVHYVDGKVHKCDCGKTFKSNRYLRVHVKNAHSR